MNLVCHVWQFFLHVILAVLFCVSLFIILINSTSEWGKPIITQFYCLNLAYSKTPLGEMYDNLVIGDQEEGGIIVANNEIVKQKQTFVLVGRFLTKKNIYCNAAECHRRLIEAEWGNRGAWFRRITIFF